MLMLQLGPCLGLNSCSSLCLNQLLQSTFCQGVICGLGIQSARQPVQTAAVAPTKVLLICQALARMCCVRLQAGDGFIRFSSQPVAGLL
jgi:hypothetical protein